MQCLPRHCFVLLLLQACLPTAAIVERRQALARREPTGDEIPQSDLVGGSGDYNTLKQLQGALSEEMITRAATQLEEANPAEYLQRTVDCPPKDAADQIIDCSAEADNLNFHQGCWDCYPQSYVTLYCNKNSLTQTFVDMCATSSEFKGAYCKDFYTNYHEECFFPGSEYKQLYCENTKHQGKFHPKCARDSEVGPNYCESFAVRGEGYGACHLHPGFMLLYCQAKQTARTMDTACANHEQVGANFCEDFALAGPLLSDCAQYTSYMSLFCDTKATANVSVESCGTNPHVAGMYCQQMALKKNGMEACWGVAEFETTYCAEIDHYSPLCDSLSSSNQMNQGQVS